METPPPECRRAAAVCYRPTADGLRFLVVQTSDGRFWTLPKGHIEEGETSWDAAAREAEEEAGVRGRVAKDPLLRYRYPVGESTSPCPTLFVDAFLLEPISVSERSGPDRDRKQEWVDAETAKRLLSEGREPSHAAEHARVIDRAVDVLTGASHTPVIPGA